MDSKVLQMMLMYVLYSFGLHKTGPACSCLLLKNKQYLDAHVGTLLHAFVTQLVLRPCALDKDHTVKKFEFSFVFRIMHGTVIELV